MANRQVVTRAGKNHPELSAFIRRRREELEMTQLALARKIGYRYHNAIALIERGSMMFPLDQAYQFADALEVPRHEFLELVFQELYPDYAELMVFRPARTLKVKKSEE